jgi:hypothetical protein
MALRWLWAVAGFVALDARAELVVTTVVRVGSVVPGQLAGETYALSDVDEARALSDGTVYFWAKGTSSIPIAGSREGIWSATSGGTFTAEVVEGNGVPNEGSAIRIGDLAGNNDVIPNYVLNPAGIELSVRLKGGGVNANTDRAILYRKAGVNYLIYQAQVADSRLFTGVSLKPNAIVFSALRQQQIPEANSLVSSIVNNQGMPAIFNLADAPGGVIGEAGSSYTWLRRIVMNAAGTNAYLSIVENNGASEFRIGVSDGANYTFPLGRDTVIAGTGGALALDASDLVLPRPAGGWWLSGTVLAGGAPAGIMLPFLFENNALTSLFPGGLIASLFGENGSSRTISSMGMGIEGSLALVATIENDNGDLRTALLHRKPDGTWRLIGEQGRILVVDRVARVLTRVAPSTQSVAADGTVFFFAVLDGNQEAILAARETSENPVVRVIGPAQRRTTRARVVIRGTASDDGTIVRVNYRVGRAAARAAAGTTNWRFSAPLRPGRNRIEVRATDADGGSSAPARVTVLRRSR